MEIDDSIVELARTCLKEEWKVESVTDDQVKFAIESSVITSLYRDLKLFPLTETKKALNKYREERGFPAIEEEDNTNGN